MSEQSEQLVLDYLRRAGDAARGTLRADQRLDFLRRLRGRIEEFRDATGASGPDDVRKVLARFGDPVVLVRRERERLERERAERAASGDAIAWQEAASGGVGEPGERSVTEPIPAVRTGGDARTGATQPVEPSARAGTQSDRQDPSDSRDLHHSQDPAYSQPPHDSLDRQQRPGGQASASTAGGTGSTGGAGSTGPADGTADADSTGGAGGTDSAGGGGGAKRTESTDSAGSAAMSRAAGQHPDAPSAGPASISPQARPRHSGPPVYEPRSPKEAGQELPSAVSRLFDQLPREAQSALRGGVVETIGLLLVGVGGALSPLPLWFVGAFVVSFAAGWGLADKLAGLLLAPAVAAAGPTVLFLTGLAGAGESYFAVLRGYGWSSFRVGAVLGAIYLAATLMSRISRRRSKGPPPWRQQTDNR